MDTKMEGGVMTSVAQEIERYKAMQPQYAAVLSTYGETRALQKEALSQCRVPVPRLSPQTARRKLLEGQHLLVGEHIIVKEELFRSLAANLLNRLPAEWALHRDAKRLLNSSAWHTLNIEGLADCYAENWRGCLDRLSLKSGVDPAAVSYVLFTILGPFFEHAATSLRQHVTDSVWNRGVCPVCGSPPVMAKLTLKGGQRRLGCGLCRTEWSFPRTVCPFCNEADPHKLRQFHVDGDRGHRVDVCDSCGAYIKTADERELGREVVLPVEDLVTVNLDILARERGFE